MVHPNFRRTIFAIANSLPGFALAWPHSYDYRPVRMRLERTSRYLAPHLRMGRICVFSAISFQLIMPQPSGLELILPNQSLRRVSPFLRGTQFPSPLRSLEL